MEKLKIKVQSFQKRRGGSDPAESHDARCVTGRGRSSLVRGLGRVFVGFAVLRHLVSLPHVHFTAGVKRGVK